MSGDYSNDAGTIEGLLTRLDNLTEPVDFSEYAPKNCDAKRFIFFTRRIVEDYLTGLKHRPQGAVARNLDKLHTLLSEMKADLRYELISRECQDLKGDEFEEYKNIILDNGSTLEKLERLAKAPFKRSTRHDHMNRTNLFNFAIAFFVFCGGELSSKLDSELLLYLDAIAEAAEIGDIDTAKVVQKYKKY